LKAVDACKNISEASNTHTTIELKAKGLVNSVALQWTPYQGWDSVWNYSIFKLNEQSGVFEKIGSTLGNTTTFIDSQVFCHKVIRYKVRGEFEKVISWSDSAAAIPLLSPATNA
jgi:hypothetical protein